MKKEAVKSKLKRENFKEKPPLNERNSCVTLIFAQK